MIDGQEKLTDGSQTSQPQPRKPGDRISIFNQPRRSLRSGRYGRSDSSRGLLQTASSNTDSGNAITQAGPPSASVAVATQRRLAPMSPSRPFILRPVATSLLMVAILLAGFVGYSAAAGFGAAAGRLPHHSGADVLPRRLAPM